MKAVHIIGILVVLIIIVGGAAVLMSRPSQTTQSKEPIRLGATLPLTGDLAGIGTSIQNAMKLAADEINSNGGINGRNLTFIYEDDACDGKKSVITVSKLASSDNVPAIVGPVCSTALLPAAPIAENAKVILFSGSATNAKITEAGDYIFRNAPSDALQGKIAAELVFNDLGVKQVAVEYANEEYSAGLKDVFVKRFNELGGEILLTQAHDRAATDMRTQIIKIKDANPLFVYLAAFPVDGGNFLKQAKELGLNVTVLGSETMDDPQVIQIAGDAANGLMYTKPKELTSQTFKNDFKARFGSDPLIFSDFFYDIVHLLAHSMETCGEDSSCIKAELYKVKDYQGASGVITLDSNGDLADAQYEVKLIINQTVTSYR
ncbi:MAG: ABC transporter substrate-binding protein [Candidatus Aenigmarchaeota archaeon]|nr:ABC transporter substrate-binding protein [Candidatus Aenigmarchaeota archaeon]